MPRHPQCPRSRAVLTAIVGAGALVAGTGLAVAAIPGPDGRIHACYAKSNGVYLAVPHSKGDVRIVDSAEPCRGYETAIAWTQNQPSEQAALPRSLYKTGYNVEVTFATPVISLDMPVGTWLVNVKGVDGNFPVDCRLEAQAGGFGVAGEDLTEAGGDSTADAVPFTLTARMTFTSAGTATVDCSTSTTTSPPAVILNPVITAVEVATP